MGFKMLLHHALCHQLATSYAGLLPALRHQLSTSSCLVKFSCCACNIITAVVVTSHKKGFQHSLDVPRRLWWLLVSLLQALVMTYKDAVRAASAHSALMAKKLGLLMAQLLAEVTHFDLCQLVLY